MAHQTYTAYVNITAAIVDYDPERAEMGNPNGAIIADCYSILVADDVGNRWEHVHGFGTDELAAIAFREKVNTALANGRKLNMEYWRETRPVYGSDAYQQDWHRLEYETEQFDRQGEW